MNADRIVNKSLTHHTTSFPSQLSKSLTGVYFQDNRPKTVVQQKLASPPANESAAQLKENTTGMPDKLKSGIENLSGIDVSDVKVHYNSDKPAQLNAHAYAGGADIHLATGQEKHLPHEAWHVVQQKQGRVKPTLQMKGVYLNDNRCLESEANVMGAKANSATQIAVKPALTRVTLEKSSPLIQAKFTNGTGGAVLKPLAHELYAIFNGLTGYGALINSYRAIDGSTDNHEDFFTWLSQRMDVGTLTIDKAALHSKLRTEITTGVHNLDTASASSSTATASSSSSVSSSSISSSSYASSSSSSPYAGLSLIPHHHSAFDRHTLEVVSDLVSRGRAGELIGRGLTLLTRQRSPLLNETSVLKIILHYLAAPQVIDVAVEGMPVINMSDPQQVAHLINMAIQNIHILRQPAELTHGTHEDSLTSAPSSSSSVAVHMPPAAAGVHYSEANALVTKYSSGKQRGLLREMMMRLVETFANRGVSIKYTLDVLKALNRQFNARIYSKLPLALHTDPRKKSDVDLAPNEWGDLSQMHEASVHFIQSLAPEIAAFVSALSEGQKMSSASIHSLIAQKVWTEQNVGNQQDRYRNNTPEAPVTASEFMAVVEQHAFNYATLYLTGLRNTIYQHGGMPLVGVYRREGQPHDDDALSMHMPQERSLNTERSKLESWSHVHIVDGIGVPLNTTIYTEMPISNILLSYLHTKADKASALLEHESEFFGSSVASQIHDIGYLTHTIGHLQDAEANRMIMLSLVPRLIARVENLQAEKGKKLIEIREKLTELRKYNLSAKPGYEDLQTKIEAAQAAFKLLERDFMKESMALKTFIKGMPRSWTSPPAFLTQKRQFLDLVDILDKISDSTRAKIADEAQIERQAKQKADLAEKMRADAERRKKEEAEFGD